MKTAIPSAQELLQAGVHFGHQTRRWHPKMDKYIHKKHSGIHVIDLFKTKELLEEAAKFAYETARTGKKVIFVGTKPVMTYVSATLTQLSTRKTVTIKARGK